MDIDKGNNLENSVNNETISFQKIMLILAEKKLVALAIDTEGSHAMFQRPYTVSLKHTDWVQKELVEKAGVIVGSVLP